MDGGGTGYVERFARTGVTRAEKFRRNNKNITTK
jgi:hypothetical protein